MITRQHIGTMCILAGVVSGILGSTINDLGMHMTAIQIWTVVANPLLFIWAVGSQKGWWNSSLSFKALAILYAAYEIGGIFALGYLQ